MIINSISLSKRNVLRNESQSSQSWRFLSTDYVSNDFFQSLVKALFTRDFFFELVFIYPYVEYCPYCHRRGKYKTQTIYAKNVPYLGGIINFLLNGNLLLGL